LKNGAQPTDTVRSLLSYKGALLKRHLQIGVEKGAITQETADAKFNTWLQEKENKIAAIKETNRNAKKDANKAKLAKETEVRNARIAAIAKKRLETEKADTPAVTAENEVSAEQTSATEELTTETNE